MIVIVDYGMGNLRSVHKALERAGFPAVVTQDPEAVRKADGLVVPGVGAFGKAMENLETLGLVKPILAFIESGRPFLGICLGLQLLFSTSDEFGSRSGLGVFPGRVVRFPFSMPGGAADDSRRSLKVPHMGWNSVGLRRGHPALHGVAPGTHFYFVHSFYPVPDDPGVVATTTDYGGEFTSSVARGNLFACQFHPEKSQAEGLKILKNFGNMVRS
ncbi:MAG TPA: imidazole glycerol phosphate synthase subunit HisH [Thermodesulfobacteriota bacterium]|nr:imidazole glycerol phosphate synthase subunit HisH [Thermodesulfobacteriota bacterium]